MSQKWLNMDGALMDILTVFTYDYSRQRYAIDIARKKGLPQRTVSRKLNQAQEKGLLKYTREGRNKMYFLDLNNPLARHLLVMLESYKALQFFSANPKTALYLERFSQGKIIFGSYARGKKGEDLDVVFLGGKAELGAAPVSVHPQYSTIRELKKKLKQDDALAWEIADNHILLSDFDALVRIFMEAYNG
ncbi:MAG: helix-turn-helix domain-containing protein [Candidatus Woesearchaeota archaeon]